MKRNSVNNPRKDGKFFMDLVDSKRDTVRPQNWQMFINYLNPHENMTIPSEAQILFNYLCMRPL